LSQDRQGTYFAGRPLFSQVTLKQIYQGLGNSRIVQLRQPSFGSNPVAIDCIALTHQEDVFRNVIFAESSWTGIDENDWGCDPGIVEAAGQTKDQAE
jgi:hypothetical protein